MTAGQDWNVNPHTLLYIIYYTLSFAMLQIHKYGSDGKPAFLMLESDEAFTINTYNTFVMCEGFILKKNILKVHAKHHYYKTKRRRRPFLIPL